MNTETVAERNELLARLLRESVVKLAALNGELLGLLAERYWYSHLERLAWLLDRAKCLHEPVRRLVNAAAAQHARDGLDSLAESEVDDLRTEAETQLHHMLRLTWEFRQKIDSNKMNDRVDRLRVAAGLSGMKGGPLRPND